MRWFFFNTVVAVLATSPSEPEFDTYSRVTSCPLPKSSHIAAAKSAFTLANLIPDLVPVFDPSTVVQASYNGKDVDLGNNFSTTETLLQPDITFSAEPEYDPSTTNYTIFIVDPDAPGPAFPILSAFLHLIIDNAQPSCIAIQSPNVLAAYMPLTPLSIAAHRYTVLVYRQPANYTPPADVQYALGVRNNFNLNAYVEEAGLQGPVAGTFFREGLESTVCAVTPNCTEDGTGYPS